MRGERDARGLIDLSAMWMGRQVGAVGFNQDPVGRNPSRDLAKRIERLVGESDHAGEGDVESQVEKRLGAFPVAGEGVQHSLDGTIQGAKLGDDVDPERYAQVRDFLAIQHREAIWWRDACLAYFVQFSRRPFPDGYKPKYPLSYYEKMPYGASPKP